MQEQEQQACAHSALDSLSACMRCLLPSPAFQSRQSPSQPTFDSLLTSTTVICVISTGIREDKSTAREPLAACQQVSGVMSHSHSHIHAASLITHTLHDSGPGSGHSCRDTVTLTRVRGRERGNQHEARWHRLLQGT